MNQFLQKRLHLIRIRQQLSEVCLRNMHRGIQHQHNEHNRKEVLVPLVMNRLRYKGTLTGKNHFASP